MSRLFHVDVFTRRPFAGNPAAVCLLDEPAEEAWMQSLAAELRMPATAFLVERTLRWFSPTTELEICGHATIATAHVLWEEDQQERSEFETASGTIAAFREGDSTFLSLPAGQVREAEAPAGLVGALGAGAAPVWRTPLDFLVLLERPDQVAELDPDLAAIARIETRGVIVTAPGGIDGADFTSRFFAPALGIPEDSVTGSAHASLGPFWAERLGRTSLRAHQASSRGGFLDVRVRDESVEVGGPAVTVARGELAA